MSFSTRVVLGLAAAGLMIRAAMPVMGDYDTMHGRKQPEEKQIALLEKAYRSMERTAW